MVGGAALGGITSGVAAYSGGIEGAAATGGVAGAIAGGKAGAVGGVLSGTLSAHSNHELSNTAAGAIGGAIGGGLKPTSSNSNKAEALSSFKNIGKGFMGVMVGGFFQDLMSQLLNDYWGCDEEGYCAMPSTY